MKAQDVEKYEAQKCFLRIKNVDAGTNDFRQWFQSFKVLNKLTHCFAVNVTSTLTSLLSAPYQKRRNY